MGMTLEQNGIGGNGIGMKRNWNGNRTKLEWNQNGFRMGWGSEWN